MQSPYPTISLTFSELAHRRFANLLEEIRYTCLGVIDGEDIESLHDFRVAIRRTRSLLKLSSRILRKKDRKYYQREWRQIASWTGRKRDLDVFLDDLKTRVKDGFPSYPAIMAELKKMQSTEQSRILGSLSDRKFDAFLGEWQSFLGTQPSEMQTKKQYEETSADVIGLEKLKLLYEIVFESGQKLTTSSLDDELHNLRIKCKSYRYALETFRPIFNQFEIQVRIKTLKRIQNKLGDFNDWNVQSRILKDLKSGLNPPNGELQTEMEEYQEWLNKGIMDVRKTYPEEFTTLFSSLELNSNHLI